MTLDLAGITTKQALHELFKVQLGFPEWYGPSWDGFWDCLLSVEEVPNEIVLVNWQAFAQACPKDMAILRQVIQDFEAYQPIKRIIFSETQANS
ncbi:barstar family protein [Hymenobacter sp. YC55]|uniref:barstar family protein n=1 Tax=Hymenobacter sp. YC55 TaxID=3034019 RepID=UPI0023FA2418|nr:barstar family protein [Hymenobacter sp. YC55]MDF7815025.1 barstar family protein [Hymenobacter sp. YC55]